MNLGQLRAQRLKLLADVKNLFEPYRDDFIALDNPTPADKNRYLANEHQYRTLVGIIVSSLRSIDRVLRLAAKPEASGCQMTEAQLEADDEDITLSNYVAADGFALLDQEERTQGEAAINDALGNSPPAAGGCG